MDADFALDFINNLCVGAAIRMADIAKKQIKKSSIKELFLFCLVFDFSYVGSNFTEKFQHRPSSQRT